MTRPEYCANDDAWVPLHIRGNEVAEKLYRETDTYCRNLSTENQRLRASLSAAERRVASLEANLRAFEMANGQCHRQRDALKARVGELEAALRRYGDHRGCHGWITGRECVCGWKDARAALAAKEGTP
jgi:hypothetical protein